MFFILLIYMSGLCSLRSFNTYVKFCVNHILFTIRFINLYFMYNFKLQHLKFKQFINDIANDI